MKKHTQGLVSWLDFTCFLVLSVLLTKVKSKRGEKYESFTQLLYGTLKELGEKASEAKIHKQMLANWHLLESTGNIARIL